MEFKFFLLDIEGFEPYAFLYAKRLFDQIDIEIIFMEWGSFVNEVNILN